MKDILLYEKIKPLQNNLSVKFLNVQRFTTLLSHWHEHYEFIYIIDGECEAFLDGNKVVAKAGDLIIANSTQLHSFISTGVVSFYGLIIYPEFLRDVDTKNKIFFNLIKNDTFVCETFKTLEKYYNDYVNNVYGSDMMIKSVAYSLVNHLFVNYSHDSKKQNDNIKKINNAINYVSKHYSEKISTKDLAEVSFLSEGHFCRFFKQSTGMSPIRYITEYRVKKGQMLLENTNESILSIALKIGFADSNYFSRVFKSIFGMSPQKYKKEFFKQ